MIVGASRARADQVVAALQGQATERAQRLGARFVQFLPLSAQAIDQATRCVLQGERVPSEQKVVSIFEPHTQSIRRHKAGKPTAFGRKALLDEVEGGIISHYAALVDVGLEPPHFGASLDAHQQHFGRAPDLVAGDHGVSSQEHEARARERGVKRIALPQAGRRSRERRPHERQRWFRPGFRFRAGIEMV